MSEDEEAEDVVDDATDDLVENDAAGRRRDPADGAARNLAVVVDRERVEDAMDALASEGVYDDTRSIESYGEGVAIPVMAPPESVEVIEVLEVDLPARNRHLRDLLAARGWSDDELNRAPSSWAVLGSCILVKAREGYGASTGESSLATNKSYDTEGDENIDSTAPFPRPTEVGKALLELHGTADTVLLDRGVTGMTRDPDVAVLAGSADTEVIHTEHGTKYAMDLAEIMFAPGNQAERARMGEIVDVGERVFDMFAGIGYFALPMARAGADVTAAEIDPEAYRYLVENGVLNGVEDRLTAIRADCRDVETSADRVVMGHFESHEYLTVALNALETGGVLHLHQVAHESELWDRPVGQIEAAAGERDRDVRVLDRRTVKSHAPGVTHVVIDARVD